MAFGTVQIHSTVGSDGVLVLRVPLGASEANHGVLVTIQPINGEHRGGADWRSLVSQAYGSCADLGLERPAQHAFEHREPLR